MSVTMTAEQILAVEQRGKVIVSASAGSGKTFVMIERMISHIVAGVDVRRILATTYTKKAAAQMREKLRHALIEKISADGGENRAWLKEQLANLPLAEISTIHSFCARLVRSNFFAVGINPAFRVIASDDAEGKSLSTRAMDDVLEEAYAQKSEHFSKLLAVYFSKKNDSTLRKVVHAVYSSVRGLSGYERYFDEVADNFQEVCDYLLEEYHARAQFILDSVEDMGAFFAESNAKAFAMLQTIAGEVTPLTQTKDFFALTEYCKAHPVALPTTPRRSAGMAREEYLLLTKLGKLSKYCKDLFAELAGYADSQTERARFEDAQERAKAICALAKWYDELYSQYKREADALDYEDLEHFTLQILKNPATLASVRAKYDEIFVDEYQDVNPAQEEIINLLGGEELFLVGDAKQSIYGFRGSQSEYFVQKTKSFPHSLTLSENFRSSSAVIDAVNRVFCRVMTEQTAGIDYQKIGFMSGGRRYGEHTGEVRFHQIPDLEKEESKAHGIYSVLKEGKEKQNAQSEYILRLIEDEIGKEFFDADSGEIKRVTYGDIAVLVRKTKSQDAARIVAYLSANNVPVSTSAEVNICDFWEIRLLIDWLSYLDNAEQDIPMAGAMLSRIGEFSESELAQIRLRFPSYYTFRDACRQYADKMQDTLAEKLKAFQEKYARLRALSRLKRADEMMSLLLVEGLEGEIASKKDGEARLKRVRRLLAEGQDLSVNAFLQKLKTLGNVIKFSEGAGEDAVKVLTMHTSKGLEYPVVILASLNALPHKEYDDEVDYSKRFGFAPKSFDLQQRASFSTLKRTAIAFEEKRKDVSDELNLLYVAMTRAKYRLHLLFENTETALSPLFAKTFADFFDFEDCAEYFKGTEGELAPPLERHALVFRENEEEVSAILSHFAKKYPFAESSKLPVKGSATEFHKLKEKTDRKEEFEGKGGTTGVETGLAYHAFLQNVCFGKGAREELARMREQGILSENELALLNEEQLEGILALPSLQSLADKRLWREQTFLLSLPAKEILALQSNSEDEVVVQGAIDLLVETHEGYLVLDYKFSSRGEQSLIEEYAPQLRLYKKAVAKAMKVEERTVRARLLNIYTLKETEV